MLRLGPVITLVALVAALVPAAVGAQDPAATPGASTRDVPDPAECQVVPRPGALLRGTPAVTDDSLVQVIAATPQPAGVVPDGPPADAGTVAAVDATVRGLTACVNALDRGRIFSFFSDAFAPGGLYPLGIYNLYAFDDPTSPLPPGQRLEAAPVVGARVLPDGRVGAFSGDPAAGAVVFFVFVRSEAPDGPAWLIDDVTAVATLPATPGP